MNTIEYAKEIHKELGKTLLQVSNKQAEKLVEIILKPKKIFMAGTGRSGYMVKSFAMRLMHMGLQSYVVGETITPGIEKDQLLLIGSGSGETGSLVSIANKAKKIGANIGIITISPQSTIGQIADLVIEISAPTPKVEVDRGYKSIQPKGSLFEQSLLLLLDAVVLRLMEKRGNGDTMFEKHANLE